MGPRKRFWATAMFYLLLLTPVNGQIPGLNEIDFSSIGGEAGATSAESKSWCQPEGAFLGGTWCGNDWTLPQKIWYKFPNPISVTKFSFQGRRATTEWLTDAPSKYQFFGSNSNEQCDDEDYWSILFVDDSGSLLSSVDDIKIQDICNPLKYICYGFKVLDTQAGLQVRMSNIRFYTRSSVTYTAKKLFQVSYPDVMAPIRRGAPNCPAHDNYGCYDPDEYLDLYTQQSLFDTQVDSRFTFKRKPCQCKCLCLDDPLCQAVTIISPQTKLEDYMCLFSRDTEAADRSVLQLEFSSTSYIKRGCSEVNCSMNSICDDANGTKAAVCGCKEQYKLNGLKCSNNN